MKKIAIIASALVAMFTTNVFATDTIKFHDVPEGTWYHESVYFTAEHGIVNGYVDGNFGPFDNIATSTLTTMLTNFWGFSEEFEKGDHWAEQSIQNALVNGWIDELPSDYNQLLTRQEVVDIIYKALKLETQTDVNYFEDTTSVSANVLYELGIIKGTTDTTFSPTDDITRSEICVIFARLINFGYSQPPYDMQDDEPEIELEIEPEIETEPEVLEPEIEEEVEIVKNYYFNYPTVTLNTNSSSEENLYKLLLLSLTSKTETSFSTTVYKDDLNGRSLQELFEEISVKFYQEYPEFYGTDGKTATMSFTYSQSNDKYNLTMDVNHDFVSRITTSIEMIEQLIEDFFEDGTLSEDMSDYEKAKALYIWCALAFEYDQSYSFLGRDAYGILTNSTGVCSGYTSVYNIMCEIIGIRTQGVSSDGHIWSCLYLDGKWTHVDVTWGDPVGGGVDYYSLEYFDLTAEQIYDDNSHKIRDNFDPYNTFKYTIAGIEY